ncbi:hypothetical protein E4U42_005637 [Claviceps africana]|uniref:BHLH domain-containing protein n=1 Tax=Claviceps africana TaxID=83212 RepID=A0A8K0J4E7_9HYPO|nr:hypothetical protein E4U42_005637 [Claviceps africana]
MPRPALPPTPGSSTDIQGKDGAHQLSSMHLAFELPPPAIHHVSRSSPREPQHGLSSKPASHQSTLSSSSPRDTYPMQAAETVKSRRRPSATRDSSKENHNSLFALPPPPTRSRKIIQMKPRVPRDSAESSSTKTSSRAGAKASSTGTAKAAANKGGGNTNTTSNNAGDASGAQEGKKKQQQQQQQQPQTSATSAAGRKIARKTAHSLIERRRRSKMNEEFALLKSMVPACTGEMHKLAILQHSIEYVRYLEDCVSKLKKQPGEEHARGEEAEHARSLPSIRDFHPTFHADPDHQSEDVDMTSESDSASPLFAAPPDHAHRLSSSSSSSSSISPGLQAADARLRQLPYSSPSMDQRHYSFSISAAASPAFGPERYGPYVQNSASASILTSPALNPQSDLDQEATAALLMLNNDRRGTNPSFNVRGLSVRDLLST